MDDLDKAKQDTKIPSDIIQFLSFIMDGAILFNLRGYITFVNPHASLTLGLTSNEVVGNHIDDIFKLRIEKEGDEKDEVNKKLTSTFESDTFYIPESNIVYLKLINKKEIPILVSAKIVKLNGVKMGFLVFKNNNSENKLLNYKKNITKYTSKTTDVLKRILTGDLSQDIKIPMEESEFLDLSVKIQLLIDNLKHLSERVDNSYQSNTQKSKKYEYELEKEVAKKVVKLKESSSHVETILENLTIGLIEYDTEFKIKRINTVSEKILGVKRKDILGKKIIPGDRNKKGWESLAIVSYPILDPSVNKIDKITSKVITSIHELKIRYPSTMELEVTTIPLINPINKEREGFIKTIRDITNEKKISNSKTEFISIATHQLRAPLSAIKWILDTIINGDVGSVNEKQTKLLQKGFSANEEMICLIDNLLNITRIEEKELDHEFSMNDITTVILDVFNKYKIPAKEAGIKMNLDLFGYDETGINFMFDRLKIQLVIQNLINNAIKYTPTGGKIDISLNLNEYFVTIFIKDSGYGIPKLQMDKLFTKFFRAENIIEKQISGSGLGLFVVNKIIKQHNGKIEVESEEYRGTTFTIKLPLK